MLSICRYNFANTKSNKYNDVTIQCHNNCLIISIQLLCNSFPWIVLLRKKGHLTSSLTHCQNCMLYCRRAKTYFRQNKDLFVRQDISTILTSITLVLKLSQENYFWCIFFCKPQMALFVKVGYQPNCHRKVWVHNAVCNLRKFSTFTCNRKKKTNSKCPFFIGVSLVC